MNRSTRPLSRYGKVGGQKPTSPGLPQGERPEPQTQDEGREGPPHRGPGRPATPPGPIPGGPGPSGTRRRTREKPRRLSQASPWPTLPRSSRVKVGTVRKTGGQAALGRFRREEALEPGLGTGWPLYRAPRPARGCPPPVPGPPGGRGGNPPGRPGWCRPTGPSAPGPHSPGLGNDGPFAGVTALAAIFPKIREGQGIKGPHQCLTPRAPGQAQAAASSPGDDTGRPTRVMAQKPGPKARAAAASSRLESRPPENRRAAWRWRRRIFCRFFNTSVIPAISQK